MIAYLRSGPPALCRTIRLTEEGERLVAPPAEPYPPSVRVDYAEFENGQGRFAFERVR